MKQITDEQIKDAANSQYRKYHSGYINEQIALDSSRALQIKCFKEGIKWMQDQMQPEWISVKERLPEIGVMVLVHRLEGYYSVDQYRQLHGEIRSFMYNVTHWMPLPSPPKQ